MPTPNRAKRDAVGRPYLSGHARQDEVSDVLEAIIYTKGLFVVTRVERSDYLGMPVFWAAHLHGNVFHGPIATQKRVSMDVFGVPTTDIRAFLESGWCPSCVARSQISRENAGLGALVFTQFSQHFSGAQSSGDTT